MSAAGLAPHTQTVPALGELICPLDPELIGPWAWPGASSQLTGLRSPLQAEQQLVDCAQNFNNHGCKGYVPDGPKAPSTWLS